MKTSLTLVIYTILCGIGAPVLAESYSILYKTKRLFGPPSVKQLATMSQAEKDKELRFYTQQEIVPLPPLSTGAKVFFMDIVPRGRYLKEIIHLIKNGASPNCDIPYSWQNNDLGSGTFKPIYLFLAKGNEEGIRTLLKHGASLDTIIQATNGSIGDPLSFAKTPGMVKLLLNHGAKISLAINTYEKSFNKDKFPTLVEFLADPKSNAELIPVYLSYYEGDVTEFAQAIEKEINQRHYYNPELLNKKLNYLKNGCL